MIPRTQLQQRIQQALNRSKATILVGPRQVGKTTLARTFLPPNHPNHFDLENPTAQTRLQEPMTTLAPLEGLVVIDEVQLRPNLFPILRVLMDQNDRNGQYLILGSASPTLLRQSSESLLGRAETIEIQGFNLAEVGSTNLETLWQRGGYPRSYLANNEEDSHEWRKQTIRAFVEQDLRQLGLNLAAPAMHRFWAMLAHYHGQIWNAADPARALGVNESTTRRYLDTLTQTYMVRQLQPWHENLGKRQVKHPKVYFHDSGLLHQLLGIQNTNSLLTHPKLGASWEGFALEQILRQHQPDQAYFWATHASAELDLLMFKNGERHGYEFKYADAPRLTASMRTAMQDLQLHHLTVVYPGKVPYTLADNVDVQPLSMLHQNTQP